MGKYIIAGNSIAMSVCSFVLHSTMSNQNTTGAVVMAFCIAANFAAIVKNLSELS